MPIKEFIKKTILPLMKKNEVPIVLFICLEPFVSSAGPGCIR